MVLAPNWAETLVRSHLASGADLVFGHTSISQNGNFRRLFTMFESYQLEFLFAFAYAFSRLNLTGSCMGNNLLIVREAYIKCGGQRGAGYSIVEDRALLELLRKKGFRTAAAEPFHVTAETLPSRAWKQFFHQTARWARGGLRLGSGLFWAGLLLLIQNIAVVAVSVPVILLLINYPTQPARFMFMPEIAAALATVNFLLTWAFLALAFGKARSPAPRLLYPAYYLFMMAETIVFAFSLVFRRKIEWKGRDLR
jgi:cellulose synthase/poly-beta-1,6-N-acetylglucosamine synthase-like glycosyltransferase